MSSDESCAPDPRSALDRYHEPPEVPRERMWAAIREELDVGEKGAENPSTVPAEGDRGGSSLRRDPVRHLRSKTLRWGLAAAALLVLGIGIGRWSLTVGPAAPDASPVASEPGSSTAGDFTPVRRAAWQHLRATESFLTGVRADARRGEVDPSMAAWSRSLLTQTRLLLDAPVADDPELRSLLEDLELVLIQVSQAAEAQEGSGARAREELELLTRGLDRSSLHLRIEAVFPASAELIGT